MNVSHQIKKPVFIVGPERSGTTLLYSILSNADGFYWFSQVDSVIPTRPLLAEIIRRFFKIIDRSAFVAHPGGISSIKGINTPSECNSYWKKIFKWGDEQNYLVGNDRFVEEDLSEEQIQYINEDFGKRLKYSGKSRILLKQPGFSLKLRLWNHVFPDAIYLICTRDLEDNVCSLVKAKEESDENFWGTKVDGWKEHMEADYRTQALLQLKKIYKNIADDLENENIAKNTMIVSYDQFVAESEKMSMRIAEFCDVQWNEQMKFASQEIIQKELPDNLDIDFNLPPGKIVKKLRDKADHLFTTNQ